MLRTAARRAGLGNIRILDAATCIAGHHGNGDDRAVLVCRRDDDRTDVTVLRRRRDEAEILATSPAAARTATADDAARRAATTLPTAELTDADLAQVFSLTDPAALAPFSTALHQHLGVPITPLPAAGLAVVTAALHLTRPPARHRP